MIQNFLKFFFPTLTSNREPERARDERGRLVGDDKKTPTFNEAWVGGQAPEPKKPKRYEPRLTAAPKKPAPKKRGRPKGSKNKPKK